MAHLLKICTRGSSSGISIPRRILHFKKWSAGDWLAIEVLADGSVLLRAPVEKDFAPLMQQRERPLLPVEAAQ